MLRIVHIDEITDLLLKIPELVRLQEKRDADFIGKVRSWLISLEEAFVAGRLYQGGKIAALRSTLVAVDQGQVPTGIAFRGRPSHSRMLNAVAAEALQNASEVASTLISENRPRLLEAERVALQIITTALSRGLLPPRDSGLTNTEYLRMIRTSFAKTVDLENAAVHLEGLVGSHDALIFFDRALSL
jgi:hypothetical protein